jgi:predicted PurR-regulated permease PerM
MKFLRMKEETLELAKALTLAGIMIVLFYMIVHNIPVFAGFLGKVIGALTPFIFGFCIAFILIRLRRFIEGRVLANLKVKPRTRRLLASGLSVLVMILVLFVFCLILIPQLVDSISSLAGSMNTYISTISKWIQDYMGDDDLSEFFQTAISTLGSKMTTWLTEAGGGLEKILGYSVSVVSTLFDFLIGLIVALYLLLDEELFKNQFNRLLYSTLSERMVYKVNYVLGLMGSMFNRFIAGKAIDSLIIGFLCWISMVLMDMPYAPLIGFVVGITNMIPVFGPFLGAVPCILILLIINPWKALEFAIFILILQQIDGNIIGPKILGDSMGLPTLWIMFAIIMGGAMFGIIGMFLGVPVFSVIYLLCNTWVENRLKEKNIHIEA